MKFKPNQKREGGIPVAGLNKGGVLVVFNKFILGTSGNILSSNTKIESWPFIHTYFYKGDKVTIKF